MGTNGYLYAIEELDAISSIYAQGRGAISGRSINVEDINKITKYNPDIAKYGEGKRYEYGNKVTYYWGGLWGSEGKFPYFKYKEGNTETIQMMDSNHKDGFYYFENKTLKKSPFSTTSTNTDEGREEIVTLINDKYQYYFTTLTERTGDEEKGLSENSLEYSLLSGNYWLANYYTDTSSKYDVWYGLKTVGQVGSLQYGVKSDNYLYNSQGKSYSQGASTMIRPVVILSDKVQIIKKDGYDGSSKNKPCSIEIIEN